MTKYANKKGIKTVIKKSDHNSLIAWFDIIVSNPIIPERREIYNFKDNEGLTKFSKDTELGSDLTDCFTDNTDIEDDIVNWYKKLDKKFRKCFKKVRITKPKETEVQKKLKLLTDLKIKLKNIKSETEKNKIA